MRTVNYNRFNLLLQFEMRYTGNPADTMKICKQIAEIYKMDVEEVADYVYINRYQNETPLPELEEEEIEVKNEAPKIRKARRKTA